MGACNIISSFVLPKIVTHFSRVHPLIKVNLYEGNIDLLNEKLHNGTLDLILDNYPIDESVYFTVPLFQESLYVAMSQALCKKIENKYLVNSMTSKQLLSESPDEKSNKAVPFSIFHNTPFIILRKGNDTRIRYDQLCVDFNIHPPIILEVDQLSTAYNICSNHFGVTLVSDTLIKNSSSAKSLKYFQIDSKVTERTVFFHYPKHHYLRLAVKAFLKEAISIYAMI
ncbi:LysR family transcriptional regulator substrate-binding protein [Pectinatus frisingensis]|uniref:LysR family transcriptional regulator substrate-binding protein n=1 Tax=Pectinatus frisingensis TaxID=865 RepID=UPI003D8023D0